MRRLKLRLLSLVLFLSPAVMSAAQAPRPFRGVENPRFQALSETLSQMSLDVVGIIEDYLWLDDLQVEELNAMLFQKMSQACFKTPSPTRMHLFACRMVSRTLLQLGRDLFNSPDGSLASDLTNAHSWNQILKIQEGFVAQFFKIQQGWSYQSEEIRARLSGERAFRSLIPCVFEVEFQAKMGIPSIPRGPRTLETDKALLLAIELAYLKYLIVNFESIWKTVYEAISETLKQEMGCVWNIDEVLAGLNFNPPDIHADLLKHPFLVPFGQEGYKN